MNNAALAKALEASPPFELDGSPPLHVAPQKPHPTPARAAPASCSRPLPSSPAVSPMRAITAPRRLLRALWLRLFGPPAIDPRTVAPDCGAFRAFYEIGSDYLPSSGTWPSSRGPAPITSDRS